jgi:outer membrane protein OmpA-like peptidoglycan-associated protein
LILYILQKRMTMFKNLLLCAFCFILGTNSGLKAQQITSSYERPLSDYSDNDKALSEFETAITHGTDDYIWGNLGLAQYYSKVKNEPNKVYTYANDALNRFVTLKSDQKQALRKRFISSIKLKLLRDTAIMQIFEKVEKQKTLASYQKFLEEYPKPKVKSTAITIWFDATMKRNAFVCESIDDIKTLKPLADIIETYGKELSRYNPDCYLKLQAKLFNTYFQNRTWTQLDSFVKEYPKSAYAKDPARKPFKQAILSKKIPDLEDFTRNYNESLYFETAMDTLLNLKYIEKYGKADEKTRSRQDNFEDLIATIKQLPNSAKMAEWDDSLARMFTRRPSVVYLEINRPFDLAHLPKSEKAIYAFYHSFGVAQKLNVFKASYKNYATVKPDSDIVVMNLYTTNPLDFIKQKPHTYQAVEWLRMKIAAHIRRKEWASALDSVKKYAPFYDNDRRINDLLEALSDPLSNTHVEKVGQGVSTGSPEYSVIVTPDGKSLFFCRDMGKEAIFTTRKKSGTWQQPEKLPGIEQTVSNYAPVTIFDKSRKLITFRSGQLVGLDKTLAGTWKEKEALPVNINTYAWQGNATLNKEENVMIFESKDRNDLVGHQNGYENVDFYVSFKNAKGQWSKSVNLGSVINTPFSERGVYLHQDGKTLYFSSNGHGGLGGLDLYKSVRLDDTWLNWSTPVNVGKDINTAGDESGYTITADGKTAYFAQDGDIWQATNLPKKMTPSVQIPITELKLLGLDGQPAKEMDWVILGTKGDTLQVVHSDENGELPLLLPDSIAYKIVPLNPESGLLPMNITVRPSLAENVVPQTVTVIKASDIDEKGKNIVAKNIYFAVGKADILPESADELKRWADILKEQNFKADIEGHTDDVGKDSDNLDLSQRRAAAVCAYLIQLGCDGTKIKAIGYGETHPITDNKTEDGRAQNRRVEVKLMRDND